MTDPTAQKQQIWLSAVRQIGIHFSKIGEIILKCAQDTENLSRAAEYPQPKPIRPTRELRTKRKTVEEPRPPTTAYKPPGAPSSIRPKPKERDITKDRNGRVREDEDEDVTLSERFRGRKRTASFPGVAVERFEERRRDSAHYPFSRRVSRPMKRVRMNWTDVENATFFDTIRRFSTEDDNGILHKLVAALDGTRTLIQCKGHFRNMLVVGKVIQSETEPRRWIVVDEPAEQKRPSFGGRSGHTDSKNSRSSGASREDPPPGGMRDDPHGHRKASRSDDRGHASHHDDKPMDEEDDAVLDDIEDDDDRDKDYEEPMDDDDREEENESGTNNTAVRVTDVGDIGGTVFGNPGMGSSIRNMEDAGKSMPLKKQPGGRVGDIAAAQSLDDKKDLH